MVNKIILVGRLGRDPEMHYTPQGTAVTNFPVATERSWKDESGADHKETTWHSIVTWSSLAEVCNKHLTKGRLVYIEGRIHNRDWEDEHQIKHYRTEVIAEEVRFLDSRREGTAPLPEEDLPA